MKTYEDVASRVLMRRDAYETDQKKKRMAALRTVPVAAVLCLSVLIASAAILNPADQPHTDPPIETDSDGRTLWTDTRVHGQKNVSGYERAYVFPWKYKTDTEKYPEITLHGVQYSTRGWFGEDTSLSASLLGERIGTALASGYDIYEELPHTTHCTAYEIAGIPKELLIAVSFPDSDVYYVYKSDPRSGAETAPETLGALIDAYRLTETLPLTGFYDYDPKDAASNASPPIFSLTDTEGVSLWEILSRYRSAPAVEANTAFTSEKRIAFSATSATLGILNRSFTVTESGYLWTNLADYGYAYFIGEKAASEIISYARTHGKEGSPVTKYYLAGKIVETGEGYLKLDDSIMMKDPADGVVFTVYLRDFRVSRYVDSGYLKVGDTVRIEYDGKIYSGSSLAVETVYAIEEATVASDGQVLIPE